ncbi:MAG: hypothetical protein ABUT20_53040 [Bacteroidota bacterium]
MKKIFLVISLASTAICFAACGNNSAGSKSSPDSTGNVTAPAENSAATNPSMADTAYSKNYADTSKRDSSKMKH